MNYVRGFFYFVFIVIDKGLNVLLLGSPHETLSMRISFAIHCKYVKPRYSWVEPMGQFIDILFYNRFWRLEKHHVFNAYEAEEAKNKQFWCLYVVTNQAEFLKLLSDINTLTHQGRTEP